MELSEAFGKVLRKHRLRSEMTQEQLGFEANIRRTFISLLELGQQQPTLKTIFKLAEALKVSPAVLIKETHSEIAK
jgi:transcriptional regulator with XRE-family HTH domain